MGARRVSSWTKNKKPQPETTPSRFPGAAALPLAHRWTVRRHDLMGRYRFGASSFVPTRRPYEFQRLINELMRIRQSLTVGVCRPLCLSRAHLAGLLCSAKNRQPSARRGEMPAATRRSALIRPLAPPRRKMPPDIVGIERRARKGADAVGGLTEGLRILVRQRGVEQVRPKHRLGGTQQLRRQRRL